MRTKFQSTNVDMNSFFDSTQRILNSIRARRDNNIKLGGSLQQLSKLLECSINVEEISHDEYVCGVMIPSTKVYAIPLPDHFEEMSYEMKPKYFINYKADIAFFEERSLDVDQIVIFTPHRFVFAKLGR